MSDGMCVQWYIVYCYERDKPFSGVGMIFFGTVGKLKKNGLCIEFEMKRRYKEFMAMREI